MQYTTEIYIEYQYPGMGLDTSTFSISYTFYDQNWFVISEEDEKAQSEQPSKLDGIATFDDWDSLTDDDWVFLIWQEDFIYDSTEQQETTEIAQTEDSIRSTAWDTQISIIFENESDATVELFWHDYEGNLVSYGTIEAKARMPMTTYATHPWSATGSGKLTIDGEAVFVPKSEDDNRTIIIAQEMTNTMSVVNIEGNYECMLYSGDQKNDWHYVIISATEDSNVFIWKNKANVSWTLTKIETSTTLFKVSEDCPYFNNGHTTAMLELDANGAVTGIHGPWNELYTKTGDSQLVKESRTSTLNSNKEHLLSVGHDELEDDRFFQVGEEGIAGHTCEGWNEIIKGLSASDFKQKYVDLWDVQTILDVYSCFDDETVWGFIGGLTKGDWYAVTRPEWNAFAEGLGSSGFKLILDECNTEEILGIFSQLDDENIVAYFEGLTEAEWRTTTPSMWRAIGWTWSSQDFKELLDTCTADEIAWIFSNFGPELYKKYYDGLTE